jgi:hypothetical protein
MPVFVALLNRLADKAIPKIDDLGSENIHKIKDDAYLIDFNGTTRELAEKIGIRGSEAGEATGIVFSIRNFSGRAPAEVWEWLSLHKPDREIV